MKYLETEEQKKPNFKTSEAVVIMKIMVKHFKSLLINHFAFVAQQSKTKLIGTSGINSAKVADLQH
jgi:hypothetical protein